MQNNQSIYDAYYRLSNPRKQIEAYVYDVVRSTVPKIELDDVFTTKEEIAHSIQEQLCKSMESFGFDELAGQLRHSLEQLEQGMTTFQRARLFADKMSGGNTSDNIEQQKAKAISKLKILDELGDLANILLEL